MIPKPLDSTLDRLIDLRARLEQHGDPNHRKRYTSLQYGIMDACDWPLRTIYYGQFPTALLDVDPEMLDILFNILEKLGSLIFQTLPVATLERYLPNDIKIIYNTSFQIGLVSISHVCSFLFSWKSYHQITKTQLEMFFMH